MQGHFSAFSLVDRITEFEAGKRAKGYFDVPAHVTRFPISFAAEAAGQLAAWASMVHLDFGLRPVAGMAADLRFGIPVGPGKRLELETTIGHLDTEAVRYSARASIEGVSVIELDHSVGPMLPMEGFDSPQAMRERFELISGKGAPAGRFTDVPEHDLEIVELVPNERLRAILRVPKEALFFNDHFPRRPVLPGTMLLDAQITIALKLAAESRAWPPGTSFAASLVPDMKMRAFVPPGETVELQIDFDADSGENRIMFKTAARVRGKRAGIGTLEIEGRVKR
jgi:3-hydroxymyristoyl/3-hydroxydecanoyl-(acyl carrier protein) dehydratase